MMGSMLPAVASLFASAGILFLSLGPVVAHCNPCCFGIRSGPSMVSPEGICSCCRVSPESTGVAGHLGFERLCFRPASGGDSSAVFAAHQGVTVFGEIFPVCECEETWAADLGPPSLQRRAIGSDDQAVTVPAACAGDCCDNDCVFRDGGPCVWDSCGCEACSSDICCGDDRSARGASSSARSACCETMAGDDAVCPRGAGESDCVLR